MLSLHFFNETFSFSSASSTGEVLFVYYCYLYRCHCCCLLFFCCTAVLAEFIKPDVECLELFARNLQPGWTSWGNEVLKFQHIDYFTLLQNKNWVGSCSLILKFGTFPAASRTCLCYWWCTQKVTEINPIALQLKFLKWQDICFMLSPFVQSGALF